MGELSLQKERSVRFTNPALFKTMMGIFSKYSIHSYDVECVIYEKKNSHFLQLRQAGSPFLIAEKEVQKEQMNNPDEELIQFFEEAAEKCQKQLISYYYKMIKQ